MITELLANCYIVLYTLFLYETDITINLLSFFSHQLGITQTIIIIGLTICGLLPTKLHFFAWLRCILCLTRVQLYMANKGVYILCLKDLFVSGCQSLLITAKIWLCPGVPVHRGHNYCTPLFTSLCLAVAYCWVYCIGSCVPVHEDRTQDFVHNHSAWILMGVSYDKKYISFCIFFIKFAVVFHTTCLHMYFKASFYISCYSNTARKLKDITFCILIVFTV